jgi:NAD(P)-dependent dehydrogenase (short-subunit alcohol dehydrogenase family)
MDQQLGRGRFSGKVAIVTGGASGIGRAVTEALAREGAAVTVADLNPAGAALAEQLQAAGGEALFIAGDIAEEATCRAVSEQTVARWGRIDYLVNNAFSFIAKGLDATRADWERMLAVGPIGYASMAQQVAEPMRRGGGGAIVNISSISAHIAQPNRWTYNAAKGAVHTLTKCMAFDLAPYGIRVNSVSPGWIWTQEVYKAAEIGGGGREHWDPIWGEYHMLRRCGDPAEVAGPVLFLLSDAASFVTATDLAVDGGYMGMGPEGLGKTTVIAGSQ